MSETSGIVNVASHLAAMAASRPNRRAVVCPHGRDRCGRVSYVHTTFRQLHEESDRIAHGLERIGIRRGTRTVLMVKPGLDFFALTFALFKVGAVIVLVDPGMGRRNLGKCLAEAEPEAFIGIPLAHAARAVLGWARATLHTLVTVGPNLLWGGYRLDDLRDNPYRPYPMAETQADEVAAILFTSGSTGPPKGAVYTHGVFAAQVQFLQEQFEFGPDEIDLATFPLFALFDPALGMTAVIPDMDASKPAQADPKKLIEAITDQGVTQMFASPALIDRLGRHGESNGIKLPSLRRVISAGAPMRPDVLKRFSEMLSGEALVYTPYGATEALPVTSIESREILNETQNETAIGGGICVGVPIPNVDVKIIKISDAPIPKWEESLLAAPGEVGEIAVRGPIVTREYYARPDLTALAKIPCEDGSIFHRMGDVGRIDERGRLWFCGRKNHRVVTEDGTLFTIPCEAIFNAHAAVRRSALVGVGPAGRQTPILCVELEVGSRGADKQKISEELLALGAARPHTREIKAVLFHDGFPVDVRHNAKISREQLAVWAERQLR